MPLPVIANVWRVTLNWTNDDVPDPAANVMHFSAALATANDVFVALDAGIGANVLWNAPVAAGSRVTSVEVLKLDGTSPTEEFLTGIDTYWSGASASAAIPQSAATITWKTAMRGRSKRGRTFLPHVGEGATVDGAIDGTTLTNLQGAWDGLLTDWPSAGITPVVASYLLASAQAVTAYVARARTSTMRKRQTWG